MDVEAALNQQFNTVKKKDPKVIIINLFNKDNRF